PDISPDHQTILPFLFHHSLGIVGILIFIQIKDGHISSFTGKVDSNRPTNSGVAPCNESNLILQFAAAPITWAYHNGLGNHRVFLSGLMFLSLSLALFLDLFVHI